MGTNVPIIPFCLLFTTKNHLILRYKFSKNFYILRDLLEVFGKKVFLFIVQSEEDACKKQHSIEHNFDLIQERMIEYANDAVILQSIGQKLWKFLFFSLNIKTESWNQFLFWDDVDAKV